MEKVLDFWCDLWFTGRENGNLRMVEEGFIEVTAILASGVYALLRGGRVVYIGQSSKMLGRLQGYMTQLSRRRCIKFGPHEVRGVVFDEVWIRPCPIEDLDDLEEVLIRKYLPKYNTQKKIPLPLSVLLAALIPAQPTPPRVQSPGGFRRRA